MSLCISCGKVEAAAGRVRCDSCRKKASEWSYKKYHSNPECRAKAIARAVEWRKVQGNSEKAREYARKAYRKLKADPTKYAQFKEQCRRSMARREEAKKTEKESAVEAKKE